MDGLLTVDNWYDTSGTDDGTDVLLNDGVDVIVDEAIDDICDVVLVADDLFVDVWR